jgi:hypothetical protein
VDCSAISAAGLKRASAASHACRWAKRNFGTLGYEILQVWSWALKRLGKRLVDSAGAKMRTWSWHSNGWYRASAANRLVRRTSLLLPRPRHRLLQATTLDPGEPGHGFAASRFAGCV